MNNKGFSRLFLRGLAAVISIPALFLLPGVSQGVTLSTELTTAAGLVVTDNSGGGTSVSDSQIINGIESAAGTGSAHPDAASR